MSWYVQTAGQMDRCDVANSHFLWHANVSKMDQSGLKQCCWHAFVKMLVNVLFEAEIYCVFGCDTL